MNPEKIISFAGSRLSDDFALNSSLDVGAYQDILWPCNCFTASIPYRGKSRLNIFEETILGLTAVESGNTDVLAEISCLNKDLVLFIQNRLSLMGFLDSRNEITDLGKKILAQKESDEEKDFVSIKLFRDAINDKLLPYVHFGLLENRTVVSGDSNHIKFKMRPADNKSVSATLIKPRNNNNHCPTEYEVIRAVRDFRRRFNSYAAFSNNANAYPPSIPKESSIFINKEHERVLLHCRAFIQKSNPDVLIVTDGFDFGYCDLFAGYLMDNGWEGQTKLKERALINYTGNDEKENEKPDKKEHPIIYLINRSGKILEKIKKQEVTGKATVMRMEEDLAKTLTNIYEALERTFTQIVFANPVPEWKNIFAGQSFRENKYILAGFAKKIGLTVDKKNQSILKAQTGAFRAMSIDKADMQASLALAITGAADSGKHPFNRLAMEYPNLLSFIKEFKNERDHVNHGKTKGRELRDKVQRYLDITKKIVSLLFPKMADQFRSASQMKKDYTEDIERIDQQRLNASLELDKFFGISTMQQLNGELKELLINISITAINKRTEDIQRGINNLASAMQIVYYESMLQADILNSGNKQSGNIKADAFDKAVRNKFVSKVSDIPPVISRVEKEKLERIIIEGSYSLQSNFIVFLYYCENDNLEKIYNKYPKLLDLTAKLADLREHGNTDFSLMEDKDKAITEFLDLKNEVYKAIKTILEII